MPRMRILTSSEQEAFDKPPLFDYQQRKQYFNFPKALLEVARVLRTPNSRMGFLLLCGYFKATKRFFQPHNFLQRDIEAIARQLNLGSAEFKPRNYKETTRLRHQKLILEFYNLRTFDSKAESALAVEITTMAKTYLKPKLIFDRCVDFLIQKKIQVPMAWVITELIRSGLQAHKSNLVTLMDTHLTNETRRLLDDLFTTSDDQNQYRLTLLKKLSQSTKPSQVKEAITDFGTLSGLYYQLDSVISILDLGYTGIRYYAGSVIRSQIFQLQQRSEADRYIHATAFIAHQCFRIQDNLIDVFLIAFTKPPYGVGSCDLCYIYAEMWLIP